MNPLLEPTGFEQERVPKPCLFDQSSATVNEEQEVQASQYDDIDLCERAKVFIEKKRLLFIRGKGYARSQTLATNDWGVVPASGIVIINASSLGSESDSYVPINKSLLEFRNPDKVSEFLTNYTDISSFIGRSLPAVQDYFGENTKVVLELIEYNQEEQPYFELVAWVQFHGDLDDGLDRFDSFENDFLLNKIDDSNGLFNFNIEFV